MMKRIDFIKKMEKYFTSDQSIVLADWCDETPMYWAFGNYGTLNHFDMFCHVVAERCEWNPVGLAKTLSEIIGEPIKMVESRVQKIKDDLVEEW